MYDLQEGLTHLMDAVALDIDEVLRQHPEGLDCESVTACLHLPHAGVETARQAYAAEIDERERQIEMAFVSRLLEAMQAVDLVRTA